MEKTFKAFVYGTLKRGYGNHTRTGLDKQKFIGVFRTKPLYKLYDLGAFPGMVKREDGVSIKGEVYEVNQSTLKRLDMLEGYYPGSTQCLYMREKIELENFDGDCLGYLYNHCCDRCDDCGEYWDTDPEACEVVLRNSRRRIY